MKISGLTIEMGKVGLWMQHAQIAWPFGNAQYPFDWLFRGFGDIATPSILADAVLK